MCLIAITAAWAQGTGERRGRLVDRFHQLDVNGDGVLTGAELPQAPWVKRVDANGDGSITPDEARRAFEVAQETPQNSAKDDAKTLATLQLREWKIDGVIRQALIHVPKTDPVKPVVFAFHGHGGTMRTAARTFNYHTLWPEAIVVYMQGLPTPGKTDPDGKKPGWQKSPGDQGDRDLKFFDAVLADLMREYRADANRIYVTGHSNGGVFTYLLWGARGDVLAAVAPSAAVAMGNFPVLKPIPVLHVAGKNDELVRFAWQENAMNAVRTVNQCEPQGKPWDKSGPLVGTIYPSATGMPFISLIHPGSHKYPEQASALISKFFQENVRK